MRCSITIDVYESGKVFRDLGLRPVPGANQVMFDTATYDDAQTQIGTATHYYFDTYKTEEGIIVAVGWQADEASALVNISLQIGDNERQYCEHVKKVLSDYAMGRKISTPLEVLLDKIDRNEEKLEEEVANQLLREYSSQLKFTRWHIILVLTRFGEEATVSQRIRICKWMLNEYNTDQMSLKTALADSIWCLATPEVTDDIERLLNDTRHAGHRVFLCYALAELRGIQCAPIIARLLKDDDMVLSALQVLTDLKAGQFVSEIKGLFRHRRKDVVRAARQAVAKIIEVK